MSINPNSSGSWVNSSNIVWTANHSHIIDPIVNTTNSSSSYNLNFVCVIKRCRQCNHAHAADGGNGCYDVVGNNVAFAYCKCKEYVPQDNLEYLEFLSKKKDLL